MSCAAKRCRTFFTPTAISSTANTRGISPAACSPFTTRTGPGSAMWCTKTFGLRTPRRNWWISRFWTQNTRWTGCGARWRTCTSETSPWTGPFFPCPSSGALRCTRRFAGPDGFILKMWSSTAA